MQGMTAEPTWSLEGAREGVSWNDVSSPAGERVTGSVTSLSPLLIRPSWEGPGQASDGPFFLVLSPAGGWWAL